MVGYDSDAGQIKHYRVDKMLRIQMSGEKREGKEQAVKLLVENNLAGVIIDRFGKDVKIVEPDEVVEQMKLEIERLGRQYEYHFCDQKD